MRRVERAELPILYVKCVRGPEFVGDSYGEAVAEFERIARREHIRFLQEGDTDFEPKLAGYKSRIPKPATGQWAKASGADNSGAGGSLPPGP